tara:strand:+ start:44847 stop:47627 length:2781 start_codon:yes stop_codon:yes gene_type:complete
MRYLERYKLFENLHQAKSILKKNNIEEDHPSFLELRSMLSSNMGYIGWFTKMVYQNEVGIEDLREIYDIIQNNSIVIKNLPMPLIEYDEWEKLMDDIIISRGRIGVKKMVNELPSLQKSLIDLKDQDTRDLLFELSKLKDKENLLDKISRYKTKEELLSAIKLFTSGKRSVGYNNVKKAVVKSGAKIIYDSHLDDMIICEVNYPQLKFLASDSSWCIVNERTFNGYANGVNKQYIIFLTDKTDNYSKIGVTYGFGYSTAHLLNDKKIHKIDVGKIMKERGASIDILKVNRSEILKPENIDKIKIQILHKNGYAFDEIFSNKTLFDDDDAQYINKNVPRELIKKYNLSDITDKMKLTKNNINWNEMTTDIILKNEHRMSFKLDIGDLYRLGSDKSYGLQYGTNLPTNDEIRLLYGKDLLKRDLSELIDNINRMPIENIIKFIVNELGEDSITRTDNILFILKYGNVNNDNTSFESILALFGDNKYGVTDVKRFVKFFKDVGFKFDDEEQVFNLVLKLKEANFSSSGRMIYDRVQHLPKWIEYLAIFPVLKDKVKVILKKFIEKDKNQYSSSPLHFYGGGIIIKEFYPDLYDDFVSECKVMDTWKTLRDILPSPQIQGDGIERRETKDYMRRKGRAHNVITPEELIGDFYDILKDKKWRSGIEHGLDSLSTLYMIFALVKTNQITKIGELKIRWGVEFMGKVIRQALEMISYNGRPYLNEIYLLTDDERKSLFEYLPTLGDRVELMVSNEDADMEMVKHKCFSLIYYLYDWGFDRYMKLVKNSKTIYKDKWENSRVTHSVIKIEYLEHVLRYLLWKEDIDGMKKIITEVMSWEITKTEKKMTKSKLSNLNTGMYNNNEKKGRNKITKWFIENYIHNEPLDKDDKDYMNKFVDRRKEIGEYSNNQENNRRGSPELMDEPYRGTHPGWKR